MVYLEGFFRHRVAEGQDDDPEAVRMANGGAVVLVLWSARTVISYGCWIITFWCQQCGTVCCADVSGRVSRDRP